MKSEEFIEQRADKLLDVYVCWLKSTDSDAGFHQPSILGLLIDFKGDIPPPSGNDQSNGKMIHEIQFLRSPHYLLQDAKELMMQLPVAHQLTLINHHSLHGTYDRGGKRVTKKRLAEALNYSLDQYNGFLKRGRQRLESLVQEHYGVQEAG